MGWQLYLRPVRDIFVPAVTRPEMLLALRSFESLGSFPSATVPDVEPKFLLKAVFFEMTGSFPCYESLNTRNNLF